MAQMVRALDGGRQRVRDEAVHQGGADRRSSRCSGVEAAHRVSTIRVLVVDDSVVDPPAGHRRARPPTRRSRSSARRPTGAIALAKIAAGQARRRHARHRDAGDGRPRDAARSSASTHPRAAGHHVQHADRARRARRRSTRSPRGASDYVTKPANVGSVPAAHRSASATQLIPKIKALCGTRSAATARRARRPAPAAAPGAPRPPRRRAVAGVDVAGHRRLDRRAERAGARCSRRCPRDLPVPIADRAAHAADVHAAARRAARHAVGARACAEARDGERLRPGTACDRAGRLPHGGRARRGTASVLATQPGPAGELLPAGGRRAVPLGRRRVYGAARARRRPDRHGAGRPARLRGDPRGRRARARAGRGDAASSGACRAPSRGRAWPTAVLPLDEIAPEIVSACASAAGTPRAGRPGDASEDARHDAHRSRLRLRPHAGARASRRSCSSRARSTWSSRGCAARARRRAARSLATLVARARDRARTSRAPRGRRGDDDERDVVLPRRPPLRGAARRSCCPS